MSDNDANFGGTKLIGENGEEMDPAIAGISPPSAPTIGGDAADASADAGTSDGTDIAAIEEDADGVAKTAEGVE